MGHGESFSLKPKQNLPKQTLALIWLYLQIIGTPVKRLLAEEDLWMLDRDDFEKAYLILVFKTATRTPSALEMRELISKHFLNESHLTKWSNYIYQKVFFQILNYLNPKLKLLKYHKYNTYFSLPENFLKNVCTWLSNPIINPMALHH